MQIKLFLNSASGTLLFLVNLATAFVLSPVLVRQLGNRDYGIWDLIVSLCGYLGLLEVGVGPAIIRFIARGASQEDEVEVKRVFVTSFITLCSMGVLCLAIMSLIALNPGKVLNLAPGRKPPFVPVVHPGRSKSPDTIFRNCSSGLSYGSATALSDQPS